MRTILKVYAKEIGHLKVEELVPGRLPDMVWTTMYRALEYPLQDFFVEQGPHQKIIDLLGGDFALRRAYNDSALHFQELLRAEQELFRRYPHQVRIKVWKERDGDMEDEERLFWTVHAVHDGVVVCGPALHEVPQIHLEFKPERIACVDLPDADEDSNYGDSGDEDEDGETPSTNLHHSHADGGCVHIAYKACCLRGDEGYGDKSDSDDYESDSDSDSQYSYKKRKQDVWKCYEIDMKYFRRSCARPEAIYHQLDKELGQPDLVQICLDYDCDGEPQ